MTGGRAPPEPAKASGELTRALWARKTVSISAMADAISLNDGSPVVTAAGATGVGGGRGGGHDGDGDGGGVYNPNRSVGQRARHGRNAVAARRVGAHKSREADNDVREVGRRVEGPTSGARRAPIDVNLGEAVRELEPSFRGPPQVVDDDATHGVMVRLGGTDGLNDAVDDQVDIEVLARCEGVVVCLQEGS